MLERKIKDFVTILAYEVQVTKVTPLLYGQGQKHG